MALSDWKQELSGPSGLRRAAVLTGTIQAGPHQVDQFGRRNWLGPENHFQPLVFGFRLNQTAQYNHRDPIIAGADLLNQAHAAAFRHQVIGHHYSNAVLQDTDRGQRTFRSRSDRHLEARISQYGFADL